MNPSAFKGREEELPCDVLVRIAVGAVLVTFRDHEECLQFGIALTSLDGIGSALEAALRSPTTVWQPYASIPGQKRQKMKRAKEK